MKSREAECAVYLILPTTYPKTHEKLPCKKPVRIFSLEERAAGVGKPLALEEQYRLADERRRWNGTI